MSEQKTSARRWRLRPRQHLAAMILAGLLITVVLNLPADPPVPAETQAAAIPTLEITASAAPTESAATPVAIPVPEAASPNPLRARLLGSWQDDFYGRRVFTFQDDGTAEMTLELDGVGKLMYGPKLTFFITWSLKEDVLTMVMNGGMPAETTVTLAKLFGETSEQRIEQLGESELQLRSLDSQKLYKHQRVVSVDTAQSGKSTLSNP